MPSAEKRVNFPNDAGLYREKINDSSQPLAIINGKARFTRIQSKSDLFLFSIVSPFMSLYNRNCCVLIRWRCRVLLQVKEPKRSDDS